MNEQSEIFTISARRCKRCGGLLTSEEALRDGYGHVCKLKAVGEAAARYEQISMFEGSAAKAWHNE